MDIKLGELFIFQIDNKYGVIQVIEKSKVSGYNVRVFCDLIDKITEKIIDALIQSDRFYFIKDFYVNDLMKYTYRIVKSINSKITMPKYMRSSERKNDGSIVWYIINIETGQNVKKFTTFNDELICLSPAETWGIEYIKKRWIENFDLEKWNNKLLDIWYLNYLKLYEPAKVYKFNICQFKKNSLFEKWNNEKRISYEIKKILEKLFDDFFQQISNNKDFIQLKDDYLKNLIIELNKLNDKFYFIQTIESEELLEYIGYILSINNIKDDNDIIDSNRNW